MTVLTDVPPTDVPLLDLTQPAPAQPAAAGAAPLQAAPPQAAPLQAAPGQAAPAQAGPVQAAPPEQPVAADSEQAVTVAVCGALDAGTVARVREALEEAVSRRPPRLVVDLTDCPFVDAGALALLLETHRRLARRGSVLTLRGCSPRVLRLLSLTGLRRVFDLG